MGTSGTRVVAPLAVVLSVLCVGSAAHAQPITPDAVPPSLREWISWVTADEPTYGCTRAGAELVCAWPGLLELTVSGNDVAFALYVVVDRPRWVGLPGSIEHFPVDVREGTRELVVLSTSDGAPVVRLEAGSHRVDGRIRFGQQPESLSVPADVARIIAVVGASRVPLVRAGEGIVPLRGAALASSARADSETDSVSLEIVRRISDEVPLQIDTQITARIGGRARPISLGRVLIAGTVPSAVESSLPIQVSPEGDVVLQAQSGTHRVRISSLGADPRMPLVSPRLAAPWPTQEIWLFKPNELYRQVEISGPSSIDPQSPSIPEDWRSSAAYVLAAGERMTLIERRRAEPVLPPNALSLEREMWLDFDGGGFTVRDEIAGEMHRAERLDLLQGELGRVTLGEVDQLITLPPGGPRHARGVEMREQNVRLRAEWRFRGSPSDVPAVGWSEDVRSLSVRLHLPPGYTLFAARGVDRADSAWVELWDVGPLFLVLLLAVVVARLFDKRAGLVTFITLVLTYFERDAPTFLWLFVLVPYAVLKVFSKGNFARLVYVAFAFFSLLLVVTCALFVTRQVRYALHPQLLTEELAGGYVAEDMMTVSETSGGSGVRSRSEEGYFGRQSAPSSADMAQDADVSATRIENFIDPNAVVQTGHGLVDWQHTETSLAWTGPVAKDHRIALYLVPPWLQRVLALARSLGVIFLVALLAIKRPRWPMSQGDAPAEGTSAKTVAAVALVLAGAFTSVARAQEATNTVPARPSDSMLAELRDRLLASPECEGECTRYGDAVLVVDGDTLRFELVVHATVQAAIALPGPAASFLPDQVSIDGVVTHALRATEDGHLSLRVPAGVHRIVLASAVAGRGSIALSFPSIPARVEVRATGWAVSGIDENGLVRGSLELRRDISNIAPTDAAPTTASAEVPTWVAVERHAELGVQWLVHTKVRRLSSTTAPAVVRIAALPGESVLGSEATRDGAFIVATIAQGLSELTFTSRITQGSDVRFAVLSAPVAVTDVHTTETWVYTCSPLWHCTHQGLVPIHRSLAGSVQPTFAPYPGESLRIVAQRLSAAPGSSFTFDGARLTVAPGSRSRESTLELEVRTSVSNTLRVTLPQGAEVQSVAVDGERRAVQLRNGTLSVGIVPSNGNVKVVFIEPRGLDFSTTTPRIRVHGETVDVHITVTVPESRWLLAASGPSWGPIVLFWGQLVLVLLIALILARVPRSPLRAHEWALLVLGLTQIPLPATFIVAAWFFAVRMQHERKLKAPYFNIAQLGLVLHAFVSACILISAVWVGLNDRPDMQVVGNGSSSDSLHWYADRAKDVLPSASFVSVSVWVWKGLMLAWAFWLAYSVVRWALWAVSPFREQGFFQRAPAVAQGPRAPAPVVIAPERVAAVAEAAPVAESSAVASAVDPGPVSVPTTESAESAAPTPQEPPKDE